MSVRLRDKVEFYLSSILFKASVRLTDKVQSRILLASKLSLVSALGVVKAGSGAAA